MKFLKKLALTVTTFGLLQFCVLPLAASAQFEPIDQACEEGSLVGSSEVCDSRNQDDNPISGTGGLILNIVDILSFVVGVGSIIMIIVGGIKLSTSQGEKVKEGRDTVINALIGLAIVIIARTIIIFVVNSFYN